MLVYWGRRGLSRFVQEAATVATSCPSIEATISVSRQNESFAAFSEFEDRLVAVDTFSNDLGAIGQAWRIPMLRSRITREIVNRKIEAVIEFMPHVWSSVVFSVLKPHGVLYSSIIHDAEIHPGDYRSALIGLLLDRTIAQADAVLTLSDAVAKRLLTARRVPEHKLFTLFHPDLDYGARRRTISLTEGKPIRLAFLGRIMPYKGLTLLLDSVEALRREGFQVELGVFGEGALGDNRRRLAALGAEVINRWLTEQEIAAILSRYHAVVLSHIEASQSGVAATSLGAGIPVIATPVGGLIEQIQDGVNGILAARVDAAALSDAIKRIVLDPNLFDAICRRIEATRADRSMARFLQKCVEYTLVAGERQNGRAAVAPLGREVSILPGD
ncbi:glycosyltransferase family 4 protein [Bradyrhizobium oligotrophicum]|nr:glycosyltransferase family 4 protein [Bradyrhizobium oligotrophicum]